MAGGPDILDSGTGTWWRDESRPGPLRGRDATALLDPGEDVASGGGRRGTSSRRRRRGTAVALVGVVVAALLAAGAVRATLAPEGAGTRPPTSAEAVAAVQQVRLVEEHLVSTTPSDVAGGWVLGLTLANDSATPVDVLDLRMQGSGLTTSPWTGPLHLAPLAESGTTLRGAVDCGAVSGLAGVVRLRLVATLSTRDGARRTVTLAPPGPSAWTAHAQLLMSCTRVQPVRVEDVGAGVEGGVLYTRLLVSTWRRSSLHLRGIDLAPAGAFAVSVDGVPVLLTPGAGGQVLLEVRVRDCRAARAYVPATGALVLATRGLDRPSVEVDLPEGMGSALVQLSEAACPG